MTVIALAIAVMIGDGCCAFVSLSLGKGRPEDAVRTDRELRGEGKACRLA